MEHYDLLARPTWKAQSVLGVSPYVEREFFQRIVNDLRPTILTVVIDDGCRSDDINMVLSLARRGTRVRVALGSARGLVHAKVFYVEWLTSGGQCGHTLVYGSGNATRQAFQGDINSEVMSKVRLTAANHTPVLNWTARVREAALNPANQVIPELEAWLGDGISIRLPSMTIKDATNKANNFDLWLQRGHLLATFQPDPSFLRIYVNLREEFPPGDAERIVQNIGFETPKTRRLSFPYILTADVADANNGWPGNWRSRFFAWTQLGYWCSDACFREHRDLFRKAGHEARLQNLELLKEMNDHGPRNAACSRFLNHVVRLWEAFGAEAANYLEVSNGTVNQEFYRTAFEERVKRDLNLAEDEEFKTRYLNGCELIDVPRFRMDASSWRSFVESFTRQVHLEWLKARSQSFIYKYIYAALEDLEGVDEGVFDDPKTLANLLRSEWNIAIEGDDGRKISVGEYVDGYQDYED